MKFKITIHPMPPETFVRTRQWEIYGEVFEALRRARKQLKELKSVQVQPDREHAALAIAMALELSVAEELNLLNGVYRADLEPLVAMFRAAAALEKKRSDGTNGGIH